MRPFAMKTYESLGRRINWWSVADTSGEGMPIVFLHAFPLNSEMWGPQVALRQDGIELFAYDIFGFGGSDAASKADDYTIEALISDVHNFIRDVVKRPAVICGLSLGSYIALRAALADEDDIAGLVLASVGAG
ncbi:MAG: alpha/beta fold hydrolase, partial [Mesorhizobium sp.]